MRKLGYLDNLVIIDDSPECHLSFKGKDKLFSENIIKVIKWKGENDDNTLSSILLTIRKMVVRM